jgi:hypothetical protein
MDRGGEEDEPSARAIIPGQVVCAAPVPREAQRQTHAETEKAQVGIQKLFRALLAPPSPVGRLAEANSTTRTYAQHHTLFSMRASSHHTPGPPVTVVGVCTAKTGLTVVGIVCSHRWRGRGSRRGEQKPCTLSSCQPSQFSPPPAACRFPIRSELSFLLVWPASQDAHAPECPPSTHALRETAGIHVASDRSRAPALHASMCCRRSPRQVP